MRKMDHMVDSVKHDTLAILLNEHNCFNNIDKYKLFPSNCSKVYHSAGHLLHFNKVISGFSCKRSRTTYVLLRMEPSQIPFKVNSADRSVEW